MQITKQSVNELLGYLERQGYLVRDPDPTDSRSRRIRFTPKGRELENVTWIAAARSEQIAAELIGESRMKELRRSLGGLVSRLGFDWIVLKNGQVSPFGDATNYGSIPSPPSYPVTGITPSKDGGGYWLVTTNGTVYAFGDAVNYGSLSSQGANVTNVVGLTMRSDGLAYWITNAVGNNWTFGTNTGWYGSTGGYQPKPHFQITAVGPYATGSGNSQITGSGIPDQSNGYYMSAIDGGLINFGAAPYYGSVKGPNWNS